MINLRTAVRVEEVGTLEGQLSAVLMCDGKRVTISGLTKDEAKQLGRYPYDDLIVTITAEISDGG
jgi:hypothetical protein